MGVGLVKFSQAWDSLLMVSGPRLNSSLSEAKNPSVLSWVSNNLSVSATFSTCHRQILCFGSYHPCPHPHPCPTWGTKAIKVLLIGDFKTNSKKKKKSWLYNHGLLPKKLDILVWRCWQLKHLGVNNREGSIISRHKPLFFSLPHLPSG